MCKHSTRCIHNRFDSSSEKPTEMFTELLIATATATYFTVVAYIAVIIPHHTAKTE